MPCNVALTATFKSISRGALNSNPSPARCSPLSQTQKQHVLADISNSNVHTTIAYTHTHICTYTHSHNMNYTLLLLLLFELSAATPPPASTQHPAITTIPSGGQAVEGTAVDVFCLLSNERRNVTVGPSAGPSQPSIHTCGISAVYQTAGRQLCSLFLSSWFYFYLGFLSSLPVQYCMCLSPVYFLITTHAEAQVCFAGTPLRSLPPPHPTSLT